MLLDVPCDLEVESALLAHLLTQPALIDDIDPALAPADFSDPAHGRIFDAMKNFDGAFTPLALKRQLADIEVGGLKPAEYLEAIENQATYLRHSETVPVLASQIVDYSRRRAIIQLCQQISNVASSVESPSYTLLLENIEDSVYRVPSTGEAFAVKTAEDAGDEALALTKQIMDTGGEFGTRAKLKAWNTLVGPMLPGDLVVVGGTTSAGKTALVQQIGYEVAEKEPVLVFSLEMTGPQWVTRYLSQQTGIPTELIETGQTSPEQYELLKAVNADRISDLNMIVTDRPCLSVSQMRGYAKRVRRRLGRIGLVIIDHLQFVSMPQRLEGPAAIASVTRELKAMAKDLQVPIILVSHLNRDISHRDNKRPMLSDLFGSSAIEKDADVVIFVHREHYWLARQGPKMPTDPEDWMKADESRDEWKRALERIAKDCELILSKRRRGRGDGCITVDFHMKSTKFCDRWASKTLL